MRTECRQTGVYTGRSLTIVAAYLCVSTLVCLIATAGMSRADQQDPRLDALFASLHDTDSTTEVNAQQITSEIWTIWTEVGDAVIQSRFDEGVRNMNDREYAAAIEAFTDVIEQRPDFAEGWNKRATVYFMTGELGLSAVDVKRTLQLEPRHFGALSGLGLIYSHLDRPRAAIAAFREALEVNPWLPGPKRNIRALQDEIDARRKKNPSA